MKISEEFIPLSTDEDYGLENALAAYVRRRWPQNTVKAVQGHFKLTEGLARGVVYATATRRATNQCLKHGGWSLWLILGTAMLGHRLEQHIERERRHERETFEKLDRSRGALVRDLRAWTGDPDHPDA